MAENGNGAFIRVIFWSLILTSFGWTTATFIIGQKQVSAVEQCSVARDIDESKERGLLGRDISRIDANQKITMNNVGRVLNNQEKLMALIPIVARLEKKIDEIK